MVVEILVDTAKDGHRHRHAVRYLRPRTDLDSMLVVEPRDAVA
ncbi:hypothetical protein ACIBP6_07275 [Nonomuraea terrae]